MDSLKSFVEGECGGTNPLLQLKSHIANESFQHELVNQTFQNENVDQVYKYDAYNDAHQSQPLSYIGGGLPLVSAPVTFDMASLLSEVKHIDNLCPGLPIQQLQDQQLHKQLLTSRLVPVTAKPSEQSLLAHKWLDEMESSKFASTAAFTPAEPFRDWSLEFPMNQSYFVDNDQRGAGFVPSWPTYHEILSQEKDDWLEGFTKDDHSDVLNQMEKQFLEEATTAAANQNQADQDINAPTETQEFWDLAEKEWSKIKNWNDMSWEREYLDDENASKVYEFEKENPVKDHPGALQEGITRLQIGDVSNAVLFLEAAVQQEPENPEAWFYLGRSQADNEQESLAITAFEKCLDLDVNNLKALMSLAVCYTNEGHSYRAIAALYKWLKLNPKYSELVSGKVLEDYKLSMNAITSHDELAELFLQAARNSYGEVDPELQDGLGVLFNITSDYDKAADCFRTALQIQPENSILWNKLGATLANGNRSEEALQAYHRALSLRPGYVRTRFNLGVACYNLRAYRESIEHYLSALNLQKNSQGPNETLSHRQMSEAIWSSLKMSLSMLGLPDLLTACSAHQLDVLNREFNMAS